MHCLSQKYTVVGALFQSRTHWRNLWCSPNCWQDLGDTQISREKKKNKKCEQIGKRKENDKGNWLKRLDNYRCLCFHGLIYAGTVWYGVLVLTM